MSLAYVDSSCLVAVAFGEAGAARLARNLQKHDELFASNLLEAELRAACAREQVDPPDNLLAWISWVMPDRSLGGEMTRVLEAGLLRGADLWHVATALYLAPDPSELVFHTLDIPQRRIAHTLGFAG